MAPQAGLIRGKIAQILNSREVALNIGEEDKVRLGMTFDILFSQGLVIEDPDTGEELGSVDRPKARVKIWRVHAKFSLAKTYRTTRVNVGGHGSLGSLGIRGMFEPPKWETHREELNIEHSNEGQADYEGYVKIGDTVVQALDDEIGT